MKVETHDLKFSAHTDNQLCVPQYKVNVLGTSNFEWYTKITNARNQTVSKMGIKTKDTFDTHFKK